MPTLDKMFTLTVTVEQFLSACTDLELQELDLLLPKYLRLAKAKQEPRHRKPHENIARFIDLG